MSSWLALKMLRSILAASNKSHINVNNGKLRYNFMLRLSRHSGPTKVKDETEKFYLNTEEGKYFKDRCLSIERLIEAGDEEENYPYPHKFNVSISLAELVGKFNRNQENNADEAPLYNVAGRIVSLTRHAHSKSINYVIKSEGVKVEVIARAQDYENAGAFNKDNDKLAKGDIVGIVARPIESLKLLLLNKIQLLSPCLHPLPPQNSLNHHHHHHHHDNDNDNKEIKYHQRYLDLIVNDNARLVFITRAKITSYLRGYLRNMQFVEIETPVMTSSPSSQAFKSYHDELNCHLFMRTSSHLYHKTLVGEGINRVYEIGRKFKNQKTDPVHSSEYTTCEFYMAHADYNDLMTMTEDMISGLVKSINGTYKIQYHPDGPEGGAPVDIDFTPPFQRIPLMETLQSRLNVQLPSPEELNTPEANERLDKICVEHGVACQEPRTSARLLDKLVGAFLEKGCINPSFIINHPKIISPFAKDKTSQQGLTEKFQLVIMKNEICNAYSVETNPFLKNAQNDKEQVELGLPQLAGWILGVDRLAMILTNSNDIRDVILFPTIKSKK